MQALLELLHTCVAAFGCGCLDDEFWGPTLSRRRAGAAGHASGTPQLHHPRPQAAFRPGPGLGSSGSGDLLEGLLRTPPPESALEAPDPPLGGSGGSAGRLHRGASSSSEEMYRAGSFNTRVGVLRSASPFYRMQEGQADAPGSAQQQAQAQQQRRAAPGSAVAAGHAAAEGIELKPAAANVLLGQQHYEQRGKFVQAHPVARGPSPGGHYHQAGGTVRRSVSPLQQHVAVADDT